MSDSELVFSGGDYRDDSRERSRSPKHSSRGRDLDDGRHMDRDRRDRDRGDRDRDRDRDNRDSMPVRGKRLFICNVPWDMRWQEIKDTFREHVGEVTYVELFSGPDGKPTGAGVIEMKDIETAQKAVDIMHRYDMKGRKLVCREERESDRRRYLKNSSSDGIMGSGGNMNSGSIMGNPGNMNPGNMNPGVGPGNSGASPLLSNSLPNIAQQLGIDVPLTNQVFVANLDYKVSYKKLKDIFQMAGNVIRCELKEDKDGNSRGMGVVAYDTPVEAVQAISMFNGQSLYDRPMTVKMDKLASDSSSLPTRLPSGLKGIGMGLGTGGAPLQNVSQLANMAGGNAGLSGSLGGNMSGNMSNNMMGGGLSGNMGMGLNMGNMSSGMGNLGNNMGMGNLGNNMGSNLSNNMNMSGNLSNIGGMSSNLNNLTQSNLSALNAVASNLSSLNSGGGTGSMNSSGGGLGGNFSSNLDLAGSAGGSGIGIGSNQLNSGTAALANLSSAMGMSGGGSTGFSGGNMNSDIGSSLSNHGLMSGSSSAIMGGGSGGGGGVSNSSNSDQMFSKFSSQGSRGGLSRNISDSMMGRSSRDESGDTIRVSNLPFSFSWQNLKETFQKCGDVKFAEIKKENGRSCGWGLVRFVNSDDARRACNSMAGSFIDGRKIYVKLDN